MIQLCLHFLSSPSAVLCSTDFLFLMIMAYSCFCWLQSQTRPLENSQHKLLLFQMIFLPAKSPALCLSHFWKLSRTSWIWTVGCSQGHFTLHSETPKTHSCPRPEAFPLNQDFVQSSYECFHCLDSAAAPCGAALWGTATALKPRHIILENTDCIWDNLGLIFFYW